MFYGSYFIWLHFTWFKLRRSSGTQIAKLLLPLRALDVLSIWAALPHRCTKTIVGLIRRTSHLAFVQSACSRHPHAGCPGGRAAQNFALSCHSQRLPLTSIASPSRQRASFGFAGTLAHFAETAPVKAMRPHFYIRTRSARTGRQTVRRITAHCRYTTYGQLGVQQFRAAKLWSFSVSFDLLLFSVTFSSSIALHRPRKWLF